MLRRLSSLNDQGQAMKNEYTLLQLEVEEYIDHRDKGLIMGEECYEIEADLMNRMEGLAKETGLDRPSEPSSPPRRPNSRPNSLPFPPAGMPPIPQEMEAPVVENIPASSMEESSEKAFEPAPPAPDDSTILEPEAGSAVEESPEALVEHILFMGASPVDRPRMSLSRQVREISESLRRARLRERFDFMFHQAVTPQLFQRHLLDSEVIPRYVHFAGFAVDQDPILGSGLIFENEEGQTQVVTDTSLPALFKLFEPVDCLLLNAAFSAAAAKASAKVVEYVVGIDGDWNDQAAISFATGFYDALGAGRSIDDAVKSGRVALQLSGIENAASLSQRPVLMLKES